MTALFHIARKDEWLSAAGSYAPCGFAAEGFIHCSLAGQVMKVAEARFAGREDLLMLALDPRRVKVEIRYENTEGGTELFPHIYGPIERDAVVSVELMCIGDDGNFIVPAALVAAL